MWEGWFQMMEKFDPMQMQKMMEMGQQPMNFWKDMTQQAMSMQQSMQQEWMKNWSAWQPGKGK
jgi:hypothetical protein